MHRSRPDDLIVGPAILFAPANRPDIFPKAAAIADMVILDLEDGAGDAERDVARNNIAQASLDPSRVIVRVCGPDDPGFKEDVEMVRSTPYSLVMVPKVYTDIPKELEGLHVIAMIETPQAVVGIQGIAEHPDVVGLFWGPGPYRDTMRLTRALMHIHAAAAGKFTIDAVHADFHDQQGMFEEAVDAARSGFAGSACIHPKQVETVRRAYRPEPAQVEWALRVVDESQHYPGAFKLDGEMVDAPLIAQAHRVLARAHGAG